MKATWNNQVIAQSDTGYMVEGNAYFPPNSLEREFVRPSAKHTTCHWKGEASYYTLDVNGQLNQEAAWYYPNPKSEAAAPIKDYVAFWRGVEVVPEDGDRFPSIEPEGSNVC